MNGERIMRRIRRANLRFPGVSVPAALSADFPAVFKKKADVMGGVRVPTD